MSLQSPRDYFRTFGIYAALAIPLLVTLYLDLRPHPIFPNMFMVPAKDLDAEFLAGKTIAMEFNAPSRNINGVFFRDVFKHELHELRVKITNLATGATAETIQTANGSRKFKGFSNKRSDPVLLEVQWLKDRGPAPFTELKLRSGGEQAWRSVPVPGGPHILSEGQMWSATVIAPASDLNRIDLSPILTDPKTRLAVEIENLDRPGTKERLIFTDGNVEKKFLLGNAEGDRLQFKFTWAPRKPMDPRAAKDPPMIPVKVTVEGKESAFYPFFCLEYQWPTRGFLWLWIPAAALGIVALRQPRWIPLALVLVGLCALVTSCLSWQQVTTQFYPDHDPDHFGANGARLAAWVSNPETRADSAENYATWRYAWLPVLPVSIAALLLAGIPFELAYFFVTALPSFGAALFFHAILRRGFQLEPVHAFTGTVMAICHHLALKSFSKPSTDPLGYLFLLAGLFLVIERLRFYRVELDWWLAAVVFLSLLTRPPGLLISPALVGMAILADAWCAKQFKLAPAFWTGLRAGVFPLALVLLLHLYFGWAKNMSDEDYSRSSATVERFLKMSVTVLQFLPVFWIWAWSRRKEPALWVIGLWILTYAGILILVRPGYVPRLFMPFAFALLVPAILGLREMWIRAGALRWTGAALTSLYLALNIGIVIYHSSVMFRPPAWIAEYIYH